MVNLLPKKKKGGKGGTENALFAQTQTKRHRSLSRLGGRDTIQEEEKEAKAHYPQGGGREGEREEGRGGIASRRVQKEGIRYTKESGEEVRNREKRGEVPVRFISREGRKREKGKERKVLPKKKPLSGPSAEARKKNELVTYPRPYYA